MTIYEDVRAGDIVLGHDSDLWGVSMIEYEPQLAITLVKDEGRTRVVGRPPAGTPVVIVERAAVEPDGAAAAALHAAGLGVELISERWES